MTKREAVSKVKSGEAQQNNIWLAKFFMSLHAIFFAKKPIFHGLHYFLLKY